MTRAANNYLYYILVIYVHLCVTNLIPYIYYHLCHFYSYLSMCNNWKNTATHFVSEVVKEEKKKKCVGSKIPHTVKQVLFRRSF